MGRRSPLPVFNTKSRSARSGTSRDTPRPRTGRKKSSWTNLDGLGPVEAHSSLRMAEWLECCNCRERVRDPVGQWEDQAASLRTSCVTPGAARRLSRSNKLTNHSKGLPFAAICQILKNRFAFSSSRHDGTPSEWRSSDIPPPLTRQIGDDLVAQGLKPLPERWF